MSEIDKLLEQMTPNQRAQFHEERAAVQATAAREEEQRQHNVDEACRRAHARLAQAAPGQPIPEDKEPDEPGTPVPPKP